VADAGSTEPIAGRILVADDQRQIVHALRLLLEGEAFRVEAASSPAGALQAIERADFDAAIIDLNYSRDTTSGSEGLDLLAAIRRVDATLPVIVMTAWGSVEGAVEAMRRGARDYVEKPWENARLLAQLRIAVELGRALRKSRRLEQENQRLRGESSPPPLARSRAMQQVMKMIERVGPSDVAVLVTGEHGVGKEIVARALHAASERSAAALVTVNAGGLPDGVFESELFGHVRGAFTDAKTDRAGCFELADGGTLFLDEIGNMPLGQQAKLLRVLQTGELRPVGSSRTRRVDVRLIAATNADLQEEVRGRRFREDLLYRLNTVEIRVPPLRERVEDIPELAHEFLAQRRARYPGAPARFSDEAMAALVAHAWPGNVRELEHAIERAALMAEGEAIAPVDLGLAPRAGEAVALERMTLEDAEKALIRRALDRCGGNVVQAASELGMSRSALYRRLQRHGMAGEE
jgi:DNA-binding NtrC family response regulator